MLSPNKLFLGAVAVASTFSAANGLMRGFTWAVDNRWATKTHDLTLIKWYHHWADGPVSQMSSKLEYVPMFWGPKEWDKWNSRVAEMKKKTPKNLMGFNEPDVSSQSNMDANYAAQLWMEQIHPWAAKGTKLCSPAIVYDLNWMSTFLSAVSKKGGHVDSICIHWYGSYKDLAGFKKWVQTVHTKFNKPIWITEVGITTGSKPSQTNVKNFLMQSVSWLQTQSYVQRVSWFGCFANSNPPDSYATGKNGLYTASGALSDMMYWFGYSTSPDRRAIGGRHHVLSRDDIRDADDDGEDDGDHCDEFCKLRSAQFLDDEEIRAFEARYAEEAREVEEDEEEEVHCDKFCQLRNAQLEDRAVEESSL